MTTDSSQLATRNSRLIWAIVGLVGLLIAFTPAPAVTASPADRHIHLTAESFEYSPATITVNPGDRVTIELSSADVVHGFYLDGYGLDLAADPGQSKMLTFVADRPGAFRFRCSVTCGPLHPFMIGKLRVGPNWLWRRGVGLAALAVVAGVVLARRQ